MATEPKKKPKGMTGGVWTKDSGVPVPQDIDGASVTPGPKKAPTPKRAASAQPDPAYDNKSEGPNDPPIPKDAMYAKGGSVGSASRRADGIAKKGKTKGRML